MNIDTAENLVWERKSWYWLTEKTCWPRWKSEEAGKEWHAEMGTADWSPTWRRSRVMIALERRNKTELNWRTYFVFGKTPSDHLFWSSNMCMILRWRLWIAQKKNQSDHAFLIVKCVNKIGVATSELTFDHACLPWIVTDLVNFKNQETRNDRRENATEISTLSTIRRAPNNQHGMDWAISQVARGWTRMSWSIPYWLEITDHWQVNSIIAYMWFQEQFQPKEPPSLSEIEIAGPKQVDRDQHEVFLTCW